MRSLIEFLADRSRWRRLAGCALWAGFALVFLCLAIEAHLLESTRLPKAGFRLPPGQGFRGQPSRMPEILNDLAVKHDASVTVLEHSIRSSARTRFWVDLAAAATCLAALVTRWRLGQVSGQEIVPVAPAGAGRARSWFNSLRPAAPVAPRLPEPHDGSFPDGGYAC